MAGIALPIIQPDLTPTELATISVAWGATTEADQLSASGTFYVRFFKGGSADPSNVDVFLGIAGFTY